MVHDGRDGLDGVVFVVEQVCRNLAGGLRQGHWGGLGKVFLYVVHGHHTRTRAGHHPTIMKQTFEQ